MVTKQATGSGFMYIEGERPESRHVRVPDAVYGCMLDNMILVTVDVLLINWQRRTCWLAKRKIYPMRGIWQFGGRRNWGETPLEAIRRCFKREAGLDLLLGRFLFLAHVEYLWREREQPPQDRGVHCSADQFALAVTDEEVALVRTGLEKGEYDREFGLREYTREQMVAEGLHQALIDAFDLVFG